MGELFVLTSLQPGAVFQTGLRILSDLRFATLDTADTRDVVITFEPLYLRPGGADGPQAAAFDPLLEELASTAPGILSARIERDLNLRPGNARSYQRLLHAVFPDEAAWRAYLDCPEHQGFLAATRELIEGLGAIQYEAA